MDLGDSSVCEECVMICTDAYSDEQYEAMVMYGDPRKILMRKRMETY